MKKKYAQPSVSVVKIELTSFITGSGTWNPTGKEGDGMEWHDEDPDNPINDDEIGQIKVYCNYVSRRMQVF